MEWGHKVNENRMGLSGYNAEIGDVVEVVKGRKYPVGMKMVVCGFQVWKPEYKSRGTVPGRQIVFGGEGKLETISEDNVKIIAQTEDRTNPEYRNVHKIEVY